MTGMSTSNLKTVTEVAAELKLSTGRIRKLCIVNGIGIHFGTLRLLTPADVKKLRTIRKPIGRPRKIKNIA